MPGQVDGNVLELFNNPDTHGMLDAQGAEILWGTPGTIPTQASDIHAQTLELLATPETHAMVDAQASEVLWLDLTFEQQIEAQAAEVLWGDPGAPLAAYAANYATVVEVLGEPETQGQTLASAAEFLVQYDPAVAGVGDISGPPLVLATFDGSPSVGLIAQYRWSWVSVPGGSAIGNASVPFPDGGLSTPIDMTGNVVLYHAEETVGVTGTDTSGSANNATLNNITVGIPGNVGLRSWQYNSGTSYAQPGVDIPIGASWTISFWFFNLAPNSTYRTATRGNVNEHHIILETGGDRIGAWVGGAFRPTDTGYTMVPGSFTGWHHLAAVGTVDGNTRIYVDGTFVGSVQGYRSAQAVRSIGNYLNNNQRFADRIDEFAIWTRELSDKEISDIYVLQEGNFTGVGITYDWTPDIIGTYTINLTVVDGVDGSLSADTANAFIADPPVEIRFPFQGDSIRFRANLQGTVLNKLARKKK